MILGHLFVCLPGQVHGPWGISLSGFSGGYGPFLYGSESESSEVCF